MKKARKLLVTLLVLAFVLSTFNVGFAAEAEEKLPAEVVRAQALGILRGDEKGNLNLDKPVTRAEALALIVRISGLEASAELMKGQTQFADVNTDPSLQWATGYINLGVGQGIINGYPDGTFKGNGQVTYAEMAKMLLYAMNYGVTVEGGQWPAAVMGKADDLELFDDVNALPNVPALRGDVVKMIDNSLTVNHLKQTGYGDFKQYEEDEDTTFLSKLDVEEIEDVVVTEIAKVNSKLDDDEIVVTDEDGDDTTYVLAADVSPEEIFGLTVDAWVNDDDEIFFVKVETDEDDILMDTVVSSDEDKVELKVEDDEYDWAEDAKVYVNFKEVDPEEVFADAYGMFVVEKDEVIFANLFEFDTVAVVTDIDGDVVEYVDVAANESELDLDDYDEVYVYGPDFGIADVDDIDVDSAIFFWENDDEVYIVVNNEVVEGTVDRVRDDSIRVDGTDYDKADDAVITLDEGDEYSVWSDIEDVKDFDEEDVKLVIDINGDVILVSGDAEATSDTMYGIVTYAESGRTTEVSIFTKDDEVDYEAEDRAELAGLANLNYLPEKSGELTYAVIKFKLNADSEIAEGEWTYAKIDGTAIAKESGKDEIKTVDDDGDVVSVEKDEADIYDGTLEKDPDKKVIELGSNKFYLSSSTIVMKALNEDGELDPEVISTEKFISLEVDANNEAVVFGTPNKDADFIVMLNKEFEGSEDDILYGVVTADPWRESGDYYAEIHVFEEGKVDYKVNDRSKFAQGTVVAFKLNNDDEATLSVSEQVYNEGNNSFTYDDGFVTVEDGPTYKVADDAVLYSLDEEGEIDDKISESKLDNYDYIRFVVKDEMIVAAVVSEIPSTDDPSDDEEETVTYEGTYILDGNTYIKLDGKMYPFVGTVPTDVYDDDEVTVTFGEIRGEVVVLEIKKAD